MMFAALFPGNKFPGYPYLVRFADCPEQMQGRPARGARTVGSLVAVAHVHQR